MNEVVQRVKLDSDIYQILGYGTTVPTSWTTIHTVPAGYRTIVMNASFVSTDGTDYTLQIRLQSPTGTNVEIAQAQLVEDGEQWRPVKEVTCIPLTGGWKIQIIGSGAGTVNVCYFFSGDVQKMISKT